MPRRARRHTRGNADLDAEPAGVAHGCQLPNKGPPLGVDQGDLDLRAAAVARVAGRVGGRYRHKLPGGGPVRRHYVVRREARRGRGLPSAAREAQGNQRDDQSGRPELEHGHSLGISHEVAAPAHNLSRGC